MTDEIKIKFDLEDIEKRSADEKLNLLLRIAFSNHATLNSHGKILFGNGTEGLCDIARSNKKAIKLLYSAFVLAVTGVIAFLFAHITGGK
jgi:hypothetical protein